MQRVEVQVGRAMRRVCGMEGANDDTSSDDRALLERFLPIIRFNEGEYFLPMSTTDFLARCELWERRGRKQRVRVAEAGELDHERLVQLAAAAVGPQSLHFVPEPPSRAESMLWQLDSERPRFVGSSRLGSVGVMSRLIDAVLRFSLLVRGRVATRAEMGAELAYRPLRGGTPTCHGRVVRQAGWTVVQYWFLYAFNDWRSRAHGVNDHEGDWEQVTVFLAERDGNLEPQWVVFSAHDEKGDDLRRRWDDPDLTKVGERPVVYAGLGSHSGAYLPGDYLVEVDTQVLGRLYDVARRLTRLLLPWTRDEQGGKLGAPYIDYARGDGAEVGTGDLAWSLEVIGDDTDWVTEYTGLWGHDTQDPLGGERGPAGPRYERDASIRLSWRDPVGWSGLGKIAPDRPTLLADAQARLRAIDERLQDIDDDRPRLLAEARVAAAVHSPVTAAAEDALATAEADASMLVEERRRLQRYLATPPSEPGPHAHLRHRRLPMPPANSVRRRVLRVWAALSTPLVLVAIAVMVMAPGPSVAVLAGVSLFIIFTVEAIARKRLVAFLTTAILFGITVIAVGALVAALWAAWRATVTILLLVAAGVVLVLNVSELRKR